MNCFTGLNPSNVVHVKTLSQTGSLQTMDNNLICQTHVHAPASPVFIYHVVWLSSRHSVFVEIFLENSNTVAKWLIFFCKSSTNNFNNTTFSGTQMKMKLLISQSVKRTCLKHDILSLAGFEIGLRLLAIDM